MPLGTDYAQQDCSLARALEIVGERWSLLIVRDAFYGVRKFNDFLAHLDIPRAVLAARLQSLTEAGVLDKRTYQRSPARYHYVLTDAGRELWQPIYALSQWGERHTATTVPRTVFSHHPCGTRLDKAGNCPSCARPVPPEDVIVRRGENAMVRSDPVSQALATPHRLFQPLDASPSTES